MMYIVFLSLNIVLIKADSAACDEMQHYAAFHLGLHCLPKNKMYPLRGVSSMQRFRYRFKVYILYPSNWYNYGSEYEKNYLFHPK